jgi:hypothetical protein
MHVRQRFLQPVFTILPRQRLPEHSRHDSKPVDEFRGPLSRNPKRAEADDPLHVVAHREGQNRGRLDARSAEVLNLQRAGQILDAAERYGLTHLCHRKKPWNPLARQFAGLNATAPWSSPRMRSLRIS